MTNVPTFTYRPDEVVDGYVVRVYGGGTPVDWDPDIALMRIKYWEQNRQAIGETLASWMGWCERRLRAHTERREAERPPARPARLAPFRLSLRQVG